MEMTGIEPILAGKRRFASVHFGERLERTTKPAAGTQATSQTIGREVNSK